MTDTCYLLRLYINHVSPTIRRQRCTATGKRTPRAPADQLKLAAAATSARAPLRLEVCVHHLLLVLLADDHPVKLGHAAPVDRLEPGHRLDKVDLEAPAGQRDVGQLQVHLQPQRYTRTQECAQ